MNIKHRDVEKSKTRLFLNWSISFFISCLTLTRPRNLLLSGKAIKRVPREKGVKELEIDVDEREPRKAVNGSGEREHVAVEKTLGAFTYLYYLRDILPYLIRRRYYSLFYCCFMMTCETTIKKFPEKYITNSSGKFSRNIYILLIRHLAVQQ